MLEKVKLALRISTNAFDSELQDLIYAAYLDLGLSGIGPDHTDPLYARAVITYCKMHFGSPDEFDRLARSYHSMKSALGVSPDYLEGD